MKCPFCGHDESKVVDKRETEDQKATRRRRECLKCEKRFTTYERLESTTIMVIKKNETRQQFDRTKILSGLIKACEKRPITMDQIEKAVSEIELEISTSGVKEIKTSDIGELIMDKLKALDDVAYIRFASVYREFADLKSFEAALKTLSKKKKN
ncbi:MAG: transcriptional regulator NrdR [Candidatus Woesearchaeota archaeon]|jgi:transcriptional repressor NrdR